MVSNVVKHSGATWARVDVSQPGGGLRLVVTDDGRGGAGGTGSTSGTGLRGLAERIAPVDGALTYLSVTISPYRPLHE